MGYMLAAQTSVGVGKTIEAGLFLAETARDRPPAVSRWTIPSGHHRVPALRLGQRRREETARHTDHRPAAAVRAEVTLRPESFARRRIRARTVPRQERLTEPRRQERYRELRRRVEEREADGRHQSRTTTVGMRRVRDSDAREAVLLRSGGLCENPWCLLRALPYRTAAGGCLLEVDHIDDHALGGRDHPSAMIALCPNCHAHKTRGADRTELRERLRSAAVELDAVQDMGAGRTAGAVLRRSEVVLEQCAALLVSLDDADRERALASLAARFG
ncbi:HNH endonuclease [Streptomyces sp. NPDC089424]|uniref:HNH endonuclease n=1 Tax=Streptomyces sp. NPDC089424 TaxID=3365917 RepID=UPI0038107CB8